MPLPRLSTTPIVSGYATVLRWPAKRHWSSWLKVSAECCCETSYSLNFLLQLFSRCCSHVLVFVTAKNGTDLPPEQVRQLQQQ